MLLLRNSRHHTIALVLGFYVPTSKLHTEHRKDQCASAGFSCGSVRIKAANNKAACAEAETEERFWT